MAVQGAEDHTHTAMCLGPPGALLQEQGPDLEGSGKHSQTKEKPQGKPAAVRQGRRQARPDAEESPLSWEPEAEEEELIYRPSLSFKKKLTEDTEPFPVACFLSEL